MGNVAAKVRQRQTVLTSHSLQWALFMGFEHDRIHLETSSVLLRQMPATMVEKPIGWQYAPLSVSLDDKPLENKFVSVERGTVTLGKPEDFPSYGWDNEYGSVTMEWVSYESDIVLSLTLTGTLGCQSFKRRNTRSPTESSMSLWWLEDTRRSRVGRPRDGCGSATEKPGIQPSGSVAKDASLVWVKVFWDTRIATTRSWKTTSSSTEPPSTSSRCHGTGLPKSIITKRRLIATGLAKVPRMCFDCFFFFFF